MGNLYDHLRSHVQPALESKLEEFALLGYGQVSEQELWNFLHKKKWKKAEEDKSVSQIVEDILSTKVGEFFNFASVEAFKGAEFSFDNEEDLKELLK